MRLYPSCFPTLELLESYEAKLGVGWGGELLKRAFSFQQDNSSSYETIYSKGYISFTVKIQKNQPLTEYIYIYVYIFLLFCFV